MHMALCLHRIKLVSAVSNVIKAFKRANTTKMVADNKVDTTDRVLNVRDSAKLISENAKHVKINPQGVTKCAELIFEALRTKKLSLKNFKQSSLHPKVADEKAIDWIFLIDTLNFSFWTGSLKSSEGDRTVPKWEVKYKDVNYTGYFACCAGVNRAIDEGMDITNPKVYGDLTVDDINRIFRSETDTGIPLVEDRVKNLKEVSEVLLSKFNGTFVECVKQSNGSAAALLDLIVAEFPCYRDQSLYSEDTIVTFYKRAQILVADIWACFEGRGLGKFDDIDDALTMFADYRIPQVLLHFGALEYSDELFKLLEKDANLDSGDAIEMEIRGASIHAVELVNIEVKKLLKEAGQTDITINSIMIDHFLWDYRRDNADELEKFPYHKTRCIFY